MRIFNKATIRIPISNLKDFVVVEHYIKDNDLIIKLKNISTNKDALFSGTLGQQPSNCCKQQDRSSLLK
jgi:hypothetical protein